VLLLSLAITACQVDEDGDGWSTERGDCDDSDPGRHPGVEEVCNRIDDDCDGTTDENGEIEELAPGTYGLEAAHVVIRGQEDELYGFGEWLYAIGDATGDGADDLAVPTYNGLHLFPAAFCEGEIQSSESNSYLTPGGSSAHVTSRLGDVNSDQLADLRVQNRIFVSPSSGTGSDPDSVVTGSATAMAAADLDGDGFSDLVVGDTTTSSVRFHRGPLAAGEIGTAVSIRRPGFGDRVVVLQGTDPPLTFVGTRTSVSVIEGLPTEDSEDVSRHLDLESLFPDDAVFIGAGLASDGHDRVCVGTDQYGPVRIVCGTLGELDGGNPSLTIEPRPGTNDEQVGPRLSMTRDLVAAGHPWAPTPTSDQGGLVYVRGEGGNWDIEGSELNSFGMQVALLRDPRHDITWLAAAAPNEEPGGVIYLFALDASPTM